MKRLGRALRAAGRTCEAAGGVYALAACAVAFLAGQRGPLPLSLAWVAFMMLGTGTLFRGAGWYVGVRERRRGKVGNAHDHYGHGSVDRD